MTRPVRWLALALMGALCAAPLAHARGGGGMSRGGASGATAKRSKRSNRASAQSEALIQESFRRDAVSRSRHRDW